MSSSEASEVVKGRPCPGTTTEAASTSGASRPSVARYASSDPPSDSIGISTGDR